MNQTKKIGAIVKLQIPAGKATPAPPVGPALGQHGVNIMEFCKAFNAATIKQAEEGLIIPVVISIYQDRTFTFVLKTPPASTLIKRAAGVIKASAQANRIKIGKVTKDKIREIASIKMKDLNVNSIEAAIKIIEGTAKSMGIEIEK